MRFYHETLVAKLDQLGYNGEAVYPFVELVKDYAECRPFGFVMSVMHAMVSKPFIPRATRTMAYLYKKQIFFFTEKLPVRSSRKLHLESLSRWLHFVRLT